MCCICCVLCLSEFRGWCRSFTRTERILTVIEAVLLVVLIVFLLFLILHLLVCPTAIKYSDDIEEAETDGAILITTLPTTTSTTTSSTTSSKTSSTTSSKTLSTTTARPTSLTINTTPVDKNTKSPRNTIDPERVCSWTPSAKTTAYTHYYERLDGVTSEPNDNVIVDLHLTKSTVSEYVYHEKSTKHIVDNQLKPELDFLNWDQSDGEDAEPLQKQHVLALVKLRPPQDVVFGCMLTIVSDYWVLTSASCIEAIEEVDSLDSFVIMEEYGTSSNGKIRSIFDLQIHPFYQGTNNSYDLAAIKSESSFMNGEAVLLPTALDFSMITIGERFHILGFGAYRSMSASRSLRRAWAVSVPSRQCVGGAWALRHLSAGRAVPPAACAAPALCAGALWARGLPCNYCGGTPLLRGRLLVGVMSDNRQCGVACEPQLYVNVAALRPWIRSVIDQQ